MFGRFKFQKIDYFITKIREISRIIQREKKEGIEIRESTIEKINELKLEISELANGIINKYYSREKNNTELTDIANKIPMNGIHITIKRNINVEKDSYKHINMTLFCFCHKLHLISTSENPTDDISEFYRTTIQRLLNNIDKLERELTGLHHKLRNEYVKRKNNKNIDMRGVTGILPNNCANVINEFGPEEAVPLF